MTPTMMMITTEQVGARTQHYLEQDINTRVFQILRDQIVETSRSSLLKVSNLKVAAVSLNRVPSSHTLPPPSSQGLVLSNNRK